MTELLPTQRTGTVTSFDAHVGLGELTADDGTTYPFHCIVIADGSRAVEVGARVAFELLAKLGRWEATSIRPA
ncbi:MAG: cold-shock protein [Actinomycetes bacterium]